MAVIQGISQPVLYTSSPWLLAASDLWLFVRITFTWPMSRGLPSIVLPFYPCRSGPLDELYPSFRNLKAVLLHLILVVTQATFLVLLIPSLVIGFPIPLLGWTPTGLLIIIGVVVGNNVFCVLLNGTKRRYQSLWDEKWEKHDDEKWVFINGVAVGDHWMQSNLDRLALTFRRPIHGIHNKTRGIIFDVIETIVQRTFGYATPDVREVYADVMQFVEEEKEAMATYKKVVLILHSQGAVEGGLVLDWLFASVNRELLEKVEVYTFGSAANHFNSPCDGDGERVVKHVEHYANLGDYVSMFGILHFRPLPNNTRYEDAEARHKIENMYVGRLFVRKGSGHQMNGNYLDDFFAMTMDKQGRPDEVMEDNAFMSEELNEELWSKYDIASIHKERDAWRYDCRSANGDCGQRSARKIKEVSRLWCYRNGKSPSS